MIEASAKTAALHRGVAPRHSMAGLCGGKLKPADFALGLCEATRMVRRGYLA